MIRAALETSGITRNGRLDGLRLLLIGVPLALFMLWRLSSQGVYGADEVLAAIERDLLMDYKTAIYKDAGLLDERPQTSGAQARVVATELEGLEVELSHVSMAGSLFSWSALDPIGVRFDYRITRHGELKQERRRVYRCTQRQTRNSLWKCDAISYYLKYL